MIEINLLPGSGKKTRSHSPGVDLAGIVGGIVSRVKDVYLVGAIAAVVVAALLIGGAYWFQRTQAVALAANIERAQQDSLRFAAVIQARHRAEAQRDSVVNQVNLIESFDNKRFVWPHIMDEVSRALPPYTWLTSIAQTNTQAAAPPPPPPNAKGKAKPPAVNAHSIPNVQFQIVGQTVDIQALTRFMTLLEASPFIKHVTLARSSVVVVGGNNVTEFQLNAAYQAPDSSVIQTTPVALSVR